MGEVYRARDPRLDRDVAIKVLSTDLATDPVAFARFEREAMSVAKLSHPNILSIFEFGQEDGTSFVVTELLEGETLRGLLLTSYGFSEFGTKASQAATVAYLAAALMALLAIFGFIHAFVIPRNRAFAPVETTERREKVKA